MQMQIQALLAAEGEGTGGAATGSNAGSSMEVAKPAIFNREAGKVGGFIMACRLYLRMKMRGTSVEEQVQWVLSYVQGGSADVWKENVRGQGAGVSPRWDPFTMDIDRGRNCYTCGGFGHMARYCRNRGQRGRVVENRRVEYGGGRIEEISTFSNNLKEGENLVAPQLGSPNRYSVLATEIKADASEKEETEIRKSEGRPLREVMTKIRLERLDTQEGIMVEALLDSGATGLVISSEFARKKGFKLKKLERLM